MLSLNMSSKKTHRSLSFIFIRYITTLPSDLKIFWLCELHERDGKEPVEQNVE